MNYLRNFTLLFHLIFILNAEAQIKNIGVPYIQTFLAEDFKADNKNWDIVQDSLGQMFFSNLYGILCYDGTNWRIVAAPDNKSTVRSLNSNNQGTIFAGCFNEFGYLERKNNGDYDFHSLLHLTTEKNFGDVWKIFRISNKMYFFSYQCIFQYDYSKISVIKPKGVFRNAFQVGNKLYVDDSEMGLAVINDNELKSLSVSKNFLTDQVLAIQSFKQNELLIYTKKEGLMLMNNESKVYPIKNNQILNTEENQITCITKTFNNYYILGTLQNGVYIIDENFRLIQHINTNSGLEDNTILSTFLDQDNNLWVTTNKSIELIDINSSFSIISEVNALNVEVSKTILFNGQLYIASNNGLKTVEWKNYYHPILNPLSFKNTDIKGSVWNLKEMDGTLWIAGHEGVYIKNDRTTKQLSNEGSWTFLRVNRDTVLSGGYHGIFVHTLKEGIWKSKKVEGIDISCKSLVYDKGEIWMTHPYKGIFKLNFSEDYKKVEESIHYDELNGLPSKLFSNIFKIKGHLLVGTTKGVYTYNPSLDEFEKDQKFMKIFGENHHIRFLKEDHQNNCIWYIIGQVGAEKVGMLTFKSDGQFIKEEKKFNFLKGVFTPGFEDIFTYNEQIFFGTKNGLVHYNIIDNTFNKQPFHTIITKVKLGEAQAENVSHLSSNDNHIFFNVSSPFYTQSQPNLYSYQLEGLNNEWSEWNDRDHIQFNNLSYGIYVFNVKSKNIFGEEGKTASYRFQVDKPWYLSQKAVLFYCLISIAFIYLNYILIKLVLFQQKRKAQLEIIRRHRRECHQLEQEKIKKENHLMKEEQEQLNKKLSSILLSNSRKREILKGIQNKLEKIIPSTTPKNVRTIKSVLGDIKSEEKEQDEWEDFQYFFDKNNQNFLHRLQNDYPKLTTKDLKFCSYLRLNLSNKEIMDLLNITIRGVEAARLRLRKKLELDKDTSLNEFLFNY
ncbi:hypothetical protein MY04_2191 [Flammeovirga sp. MY04]|uniref:triple tyrosine motif-containing protein n=1 Tax=Flammeovirga sp. MY04 TaxID=1191459 RepID=UPI0008245CA9|nr:triple tyrosine motif-containing protein [Flammeovirga sp. MY04]ANQ49565.2 hypothetical protein MY04_2191 [Flammeovirga sp. MY04]